MSIPRRKLLSLIDTINRAALDYDAWQETVDGLNGLFPRTTVHLQGYQMRERAIPLSVQTGGAPEFMADYRKNWIERNPYPALVPQMAVGVPVVAEESRFIEQVHKTAFYNDFLLKYDYGSAVGVPLWCTPDRVCFLAFDYSNAHSATLSKPVAALAATIAPHLARAFEVSHRLANLQHGPDQLTVLIHRISGPALIVDSRRRLRLANSAGEALLRSARVIRLDRDGAIALAQAAAHASLTAALPTCFDPGSAAAPSAIAFKTGECGRVGWLNLVPLVADDSAGRGPLARFLAERERLALLIVSTSWEPALDTGSRLRAAFLMTPAEARLAMALMEGASLETYAHGRGIVVNTARNQLQSLFEKTGTHRQGELIAVLFAELGRRGP
jgi:DNA-binding CsgD family transcriptional regulator